MIRTVTATRYVAPLREGGSLPGDRSAGPIARLARPERFHWLSSPSSTMVQRSEMHTGLTDDPAATLDHLFGTLVATDRDDPPEAARMGPGA